MAKHDEPRIFVSHLTKPPRYYMAFSYTEYPQRNLVKITGKKWDVTDQIREIVREATDGKR